MLIFKTGLMKSKLKKIWAMGALMLIPIWGFNQTEFKGEIVEFPSMDELEITADVYLIPDKDAPFILLFHQAGWSRGAYREIAPKLNQMGFNCMAIDQRSGNEINGLKNETTARAKAKGLDIQYTDAYPDLQAAINYVYKEYKPTVLLIWGSSYSASLSLILAEKNMEMLDGVLAFSPGEYFKFEGKRIADFAKNLQMPVFITSAQNEENYWKSIYEVIPSKYKMKFVPDFEGYHGSRALWQAHGGHEKYWDELKKFLHLFLEE